MARAIEDAPSINVADPEVAAAIGQCAELMSRFWPVADAAGERSADQVDPTIFAEGSALVDAVQPGMRLGRFEIRRQLGHGGFGIVFLVFDAQLNREAALKIPRPEILLSRPLRERFLHEAQAVAALDHPGIISIFEIGQIGPVGYILSAYCKGPTLANWLRDQPHVVSPRIAARLVAQLAEAVHHAHTRAILHRDIKPSNVLLEPSEEPSGGGLPFIPRLTDFGLARRLDGSAEAFRAGTPRYMAPEQVAGDESQIGVQTDVYALGLILQELLTGKGRVRDDSDRDELRNDEAPSSEALDGCNLSRDLKAICLRCLQRQPSDRYASAHELANDLNCYLAREPVFARPLGTGRRLGYWCRRRPVIAALSLGLTISLSLGAMIATWQWARAEQNLAEAQAAATRAEQNLAQAESALVDLAWLVEESALWSPDDTSFAGAVQSKLTQYQNALADDPNSPFGTMPVAAVTHSFAARSAAQSGDLKGAENEYHRAIELWCRLVEQHPERAGYRRAFALSTLGLARLRCQIDRAAGHADELSGARKLLTDMAADPRIAGNSLREYFNMALESGHTQAVDKRVAEAKETYCLGRIGVEALLERDDNYPELRYYEGNFSRLIGVQCERLGMGDDALKEFKKAQLALGRAVGGDPSTPLYQRELARAYRAAGVLGRERRNYSEARLELVPAVDLLVKLVTEEPDDVELKCELARTLRELAIVDHQLKDQSQALSEFSRAHELWQVVEEQGKLPAGDQKLLSHVCHEEAVLAKALGDDEHARKASTDSVRAFEQASKRGGLTQRDRFEWAECAIVLGGFQAKEGNVAAAIQSHEEAIARITPFATRSNANPQFKSSLIKWRKALAQLKAATDQQEALSSDGSSSH